MDDVKISDCPYTPNVPTPDCNYRDMYGNRVIPCTRDLQDFTRLWICGITPSLLTNLPAGSTVTLNWGDEGNPNSGNPTIDLFQASDPDGGIEYLTNETSAAEQINPVYSVCVGRVGPGQSIQLNASYWSGWAGNHFIWCGVSNGTGGLNLTIKDAHSNVLAQTTAYIQIVDIKQMYERWTVGDNPTNPPLSVAVAASDNLPAGVQSFRYANPGNTTTPYILFVHGWNVEPWEKDRFAETMFKRLYWQGYQGRFGEFRWPTSWGFTGDFSQLVTDPQQKDSFDNSEYFAWRSAIGLLNKLGDLSLQYPGHVYVLAHSMGNIVTGEALTLAGNNQLVNTYVASQAAVTAHVYDDMVSNYSFNVVIGGIQFNMGPHTPNIYGDWFAGDYGGGAGKIVNFYNANDYALARLHWQLDQLFKPDTLVAQGGSLWAYGYNGSANDPAPWNHFYKTNLTASGTVNFDIVQNPTNRSEVMAFAAQAYTTALGATPGVHHVTANVDLTTLWPSPDPLENNYASHFFHSAEFRGDTVWEWSYWKTLLSSPTAGFNISNP
jgi:pimeloyl-ACP methyl ester carboxylesterase